MNEILQMGAKEFSIKITDEMEFMFSKYAEMLIETNKVMNLTAITNIEDIYLKHFIDSISCQSFIPSGSSVIDVGSGAGFPGIPIKIVRPDISLTMLDSLAKRVKFLNSILNELKIFDAQAIHMRAEDGGHNKKMREVFDVAVSRAVASLPVLCEYCLPFVKVGGIFIALKGRSAKEEAINSENAVKILGAEIMEIKKVFWRDMEHRVIVIGKTCKTPSKYPRNAGKPSKEPII